MICGCCGYERWDGSSVHPYQGRASSGVNCFGSPTKTTTETISSPRRKEPAGVVEAESRTSSGMVETLPEADGGSRRDRTKKELLATAGITIGTEVPPVKKDIAEKKKAKWSSALDALEKKLTRSPRQSASARRSKPEATPRATTKTVRRQRS